MAERKYCPQCEEWVLTDETRHRCGYEWGISDAQLKKRLAENPIPSSRPSNENLVLAIIGIVAALVFLLLVVPRAFEYFKCRDECRTSYSSCVKSASDLARLFGNNGLGMANCSLSKTKCSAGCLDRALRVPF